MTRLIMLAVAVCLALAAATHGNELGENLGEEGFVDSAGVKIHYVASGTGPLVILLHGFPDYWYTWRDQMPALAKHFQVVAIDLRGYNKSDQPAGVDNYAMTKLVGDVDAVVKHFKKTKAIVVGHDWGGAIAWSYAMTHPDKTERLVILNLPHPKGMQRELATNPQQQKNSEYARIFQQPGAAKADARSAGLVGQGCGRPQKICRGIAAVVDGRHAELLPGELSEAAVQG